MIRAVPVGSKDCFSSRRPKKAEKSVSVLLIDPSAVKILSHETFMVG